LDSHTTSDDKKQALVDQVGGQSFVEQAIKVFYERAQTDPMLSHFFFNLDINELIEKQTSFALSMLGHKSGYRGRPLTAVHHPLPIRPAHFARRQVLMREVLVELGLSEELVAEWLRLENQLRPLIVAHDISCLDHKP